MAAVRKDRRWGWGYIDATGEFAILPKFGRACQFSDGLAPVELKNKKSLIGFIDRSGQVVIEPRFRLGFRFHDGICWTESETTCE